MTKHSLNDQAMHNLQREIESKINVHQREVEELLTNLREQVRDTFSGMMCSGQPPLTQRSAPDKQGGYELEAYGQQPAAQQGLFGFCRCNGESVSPSMNEATEISEFYRHQPRQIGLCGLGTTSSRHGPIRHENINVWNESIESNSVVGEPRSNGVAPQRELAMPEMTPTASKSMSTPTTTTSRASMIELKGMKQAEFQNRQLGVAKGEFEGRTNLWAFLQTKEWDSELAQEPDVELHSAFDDFAHSPLRKKLKAIIHSTAFDVGIGALILANSLVMGLQLEYDGIQSANAIGMEGDDLRTDWPNADEAFLALEHFFTIIYTIELVFRLVIDRLEYFKVPLNFLDFTIVVTSVTELYLIPLSGNKSPDMSIIRLMRVLRIIRVLRMVRVLKLLPKLRTLVLAVSNSIWSLIWSLLLLGLYILIAAVFMTQSLQTFLIDETEDLNQREQVYQYFGNFSRSLITMFEITLAPGTWGRCGRVVIFSASRWYAVFFLGYMGLVSFAMIRVIAALFLKDTLASSQKDNEVAMAEENRDPHYVKQIRAVFKSMDIDGDDQIQFDELHKMLQDDQVCAALTALGVVPHEVQGLFTLMDDGDDEISFCEFLTGIMRLKNASKGVDLATILYENKKLLKRVLAVGKQVEGLKKVVLANR